MKEITSRDNSVIKKFKSLEQKKNRDKENDFIIEGINLILEAAKNKVPIKYILVSKKFYSEEKQLLDGINCDNIFLLSNNLFNYVADTNSPQGIIAIVEKPTFNSLNEIEKKGSNILVLDRIQDPGNMGTLLRTADASGIDCILIIKGSVDIYSSKVVRSTTGSIFRVPVLFIDTDEEAVVLLHKNKKKIFVTSLKASENYFQKNLKENIAIVIGNEASGASEYFHKTADEKIIIPMLRKTESLNAGVAGAILMYEIVRQNSKD